ncbi:MAG: hypothetical protein IID28_10720 [Planctomycetes bacterium]|nr:hypothetical protein [Planctomycetota bacterium]
MPAVLRPALTLCLVTVGTSALTGRVAAQTEQAFPYLATVTTEEFVRAGADVRFYPFGRVQTGDVVKVIGEKAGWARVATVGPAFEEFFGYVRYATSSIPSFRLSLDGASGSTIGPTDIFAPNLDARMDPASSWKPATTLAANRTLRVIETTTLATEVVHKVVLPADAEGWIDLQRLRPATPAEVSVWEAAMKESTGAPPVSRAPDRPAMPITLAPITHAPSARAPITQAPVGRAAPNVGMAIEVPPAMVPNTPVAVRPRPVSPERRRARIMLDDLEAAYARLLVEPTESAEVGPLRLLYLDLAKRSRDSRSISRFAKTRAQQLALWSEVQRRRLDLAGALDRARRTTESAESARLVMEAMDRYEVVGLLDASTIYDGKRLPKLLRIRDDTGRTLSYLEPDDRFDYAKLLGHRIGIVGDRSDDNGLRVTLIDPRRIDVLDSTD